MRHVLIFLICWLSPFGIVTGQELQVKSFHKLERDLEARTQPRKDLNGNFCSIIKIVTSGKDFQFEGNLIGDPLYRKGEVLVYMAQRSQRLAIRHGKYGVVRYEFPEAVGSQEVYELALKMVEDKNNKIRTLFMPNASFDGSRLSYGIMVGVVKKTGGYVKVKTDFGPLAFDDAYSGSSGPYWYNGKQQYGRFAVTGGLLQRIAIPLYIYVGAGYGYKNVAWQTIDQRWIGNRDNSYSGVEAEIGGIFRLKNFALSLGAQTNSFKLFEGCVGFGIMF